MPDERPSPFTIPEPTFKFAEGPPSEPPPPRAMTVEGLIHNLTIFADFYERASADIERADVFEKPGAVGNRDAHADYMQRSFRATPGIDRVRAYVLARYGEDLTIGTARRVLGDLIRVHKLSVEAAASLPLEAAMDRLDANDGRGRSEGEVQPAVPTTSPATRAVPTEPETKGEMMGGLSETLRTPADLLQAFGKAAARFSTTGLRVAAFRNAARADGLTTIPGSLSPKNENGQPTQLNIGGTAKFTAPGRVTFYGVGGARLTSAGTEVNVGFVIYGRSPEDDAVAMFRELGSEAGVISHLHGFGLEIQNYDNPLSLWALLVYTTLRGSAWLSEMNMVSEILAHQFHPFTASVEVLKRLTAQTKPGRGEVGSAGNQAGPAVATGAREGEGGKPPAPPFVPLTSWSEILAVLNEPHGKAHWKNNEQTRDKVRKLNNQHNGPIKFPPGKGKQPSVDKAALVAWWNGLRDHFDARNDEESAETESTRLTVTDSHNYGVTGTVLPGIGGSEKRTRAKRGEKGKEGKG